MCKKYKTLILICLVFLLCLSTCFGIVFSHEKVNAENNISVKITNTSLKVGSILEVQIEGIEKNEVTFCWYREDNYVCESETYTLSPLDLENFISVEVYDIENDVIASDKVFFSAHPVVYLNTSEKIKKKYYIEGDLYIQGNGEYDSQYNGKTEVKGRGAKSWEAPKKPYKLKLDKKTNLFGFGKSKHYVLLNNYFDSSLIRNATAFELSKELGLTTTDYIWVDVVLNGEFQGNYLLTEHIRIGEQLVDIYDYEDLSKTFAKNVCKDYKSIDKDELEDLLNDDFSWMQSKTYILPNGESVLVSDYVEIPANYNGGYIWELNDSKDEYTYKTKHGIKVEVNSPEQIETNSEMLYESLEILQDFEDAIYSNNGYNSKGKHYSELADINSIVNYFLVNEILGNEDSASRSRFIYQDKDGKLIFGPVWDFDIGSGSYLSYRSAKGWCSTCSLVSWFTNQDIYYEILNDTYFQALLRDRYLTIRPYLTYFIEDGGLIDDFIDKVYESGIVNSDMWYGANEYNKRAFSGENGDANIYKNFIIERIKWLDETFKTNKSLENSFKVFFNKNAYKTSKKVEILYKNGNIDNENSENAYIINTSLDVQLTIKSISGYKNEIYVNGLYFDSVNSGENIVIPLDLLSISNGDNNVVSVISKKGNKTLNNYITLKYDKQRIVKEYSIENTCEHKNLVHVDNFYVTKDFCFLECDYCIDCGKYLLNGEVEKDSEVIINGNTYSFAVNVYQFVVILVSTISLSVIIPVFSVVLAIKKRKKKGK